MALFNTSVYCLRCFGDLETVHGVETCVECGYKWDAKHTAAEPYLVPLATLGRAVRDLEGLVRFIIKGDLVRLNRKTIDELFPKKEDQKSDETF